MTLAAAVLLVTAACPVGTTGEKFKPAMSPSGVEMRIQFRRGTLRGELIEVRDSGVVVAPAGDVVFVPFTLIYSATFAQTALVIRSGAPDADLIRRMRLLSRFPAGLPPDQMQRFLESRGRQAVRVYQP
jgi:hypothetical protein